MFPNYEFLRIVVRKKQSIPWVIICIYMDIRMRVRLFDAVLIMIVSMRSALLTAADRALMDITGRTGIPGRSTSESGGYLISDLAEGGQMVPEAPTTHLPWREGLCY